MSVLPSDRAVKLYVGSWAEWMESVGISADMLDEVDVCEGCPVELSDGEAEKPKECPKESCGYKYDEKERG